MNTLPHERTASSPFVFPDVPDGTDETPEEEAWWAGLEAGLAGDGLCPAGYSASRREAWHFGYDAGQAARWDELAAGHDEMEEE